MGICAQANTNEVVAASVVYLPAVNLDRPLSKAGWNNSRSLRHFSVLRKLDGQPFPAGAALLVFFQPWVNSFTLCVGLAILLLAVWQPRCTHTRSMAMPCPRLSCG